jgi:chemotaxis protein CheD
MNRVVGLGEWVCSNNEAETIVTYGLSSCVAVAIYCPIQKVAGLIHIVLPTPYSEKDISARPGHFATTAVPLLIRKMMEKYGCLKENLRIHLYGGADSRKGDSFQIGSRNLEQVNRMLRSLNMRARKSEVGGHFSRSVAMSVKTGEIELSTLPLNF